MISDNVRLTPRMRRCLDAIERTGTRPAGHGYLAEAMYPPPDDEPAEFRNLLKVTICQLRRRLRGSEWKIETIWGMGYRVIPVCDTGGSGEE